MERNARNCTSRFARRTLKTRFSAWGPMLGLGSTLLFSASLATAETAPPTSPGCDAVNAGAWNTTINSPQTQWLELAELTFFPGETISVVLTSASYDEGPAGGGANFAIDAGVSRVLDVHSGWGPYPMTDFTGVYTVPWGDPVMLVGSIAAGNAPFSYVTATSHITCAPHTDTTPPSITWVGGPQPGGYYVYGLVPPEPTCTATDTESGVEGCTIAGYDTDVGTHTLTATAVDLAGNVTVEERTYTVAPWTLQGFAAPVAMNGTLNVVRSGQTIPLKFSAFAGQTEIVDVAQVEAFTYAEAVSCAALDEVLSEEPIQEVTTGDTELRYDTESGQFVQNWRTPQHKRGSCYRVTLTAADASSLEAFFSLE